MGYLEHHGILGQKWGQRRFENEDGTLTEEGKIRYRKSKLQNRIDRSSGSRKSSTMKEAKSKDINTLSNKELKDYNERLRLEREYADLTKGNIDAGKKFVGGMAKTIVSGIVVGLAIEAGKTWIKNQSSTSYLKKLPGSTISL